MATAYKVAQVQGTASTGTYATLYTVPASTEAIISTISICNTTSTNRNYRIGIMGSAGTPGASEWLTYDAVVPGNDSVFLTLGFALDAGKVIRISSSADTVAFSAFVSEVS